MVVDAPRHLAPFMSPNAFKMLPSSGSVAGKTLILLYLVPILSYWVFCVLPICSDAISILAMSG